MDRLYMPWLCRLCHFSDDVNLGLGQEEPLLHQTFDFLEARAFQAMRCLVDFTCRDERETF